MSEAVSVLLVTGNAAEASLIREHVRETGAPALVLEHATTLAEGIARLQHGGVAAVLLDLSVPDGPGGVGTFARVMAAAPEVPVVVLTREGEDLLAVRATQAGAQDHLSLAELHPTLLVRTIRHAIERRAAAEALLESEEKYRVVVETASDGVVTVDEQNIIRFSNGAAERMFGRPPGGLAGLPLHELIPGVAPAPDGAGLERFLAPDGRPDWSHAAFTACRSGGVEFPVELTLGESLLSGGRIFTAVIRDVTERRRAEEALRESQEHLRHAQKMEAVGRLAGGIAHDFNNLLTVIRGHAQLILLDLPADADELRDGLADMERAVDRAADLTRQLLAFSRQQVQQPQVLELNAVVEDTARMLQRVLGAHVELDLVLNPAVGPVWADRGQLEQVLLNLAVNARDAMPDGGRLRIATEPRTGDGGEYGVLSVTDTGVGMDAEVRERMFEPFFTTKPQGKGTGLGLSMVYGIVQQSGGTLEVESEPGRGTTVRVVLPRTGRTAASREAGREGGEPTPGRGTVLLAEDEPAVRQLARRVLARAGYHVLEAEDGVAALEAVQGTARVDLLLTDLIMPRMGGRELARRLREEQPSLRVLYMSGYADSDRELELSSREGFLEKPFDPAGLTAKVDELLRSAS